MIYVNDVEFDVEVDEISRQFRKSYAYDVVTEDNLRHVKVNNVKLVLDIQLLTMEPDVYNQLLSLFNTTDSYINIRIEDAINGDIEFTSINPTIYDECEFYDDNKVYWGTMKVKLEQR